MLIRLLGKLMQQRWQREAADDYARMLAAGKAMTHEERAAALGYLDTLSGMNPDAVLADRIARLRAKLDEAAC